MSLAKKDGTSHDFSVIDKHLLRVKKLIKSQLSMCPGDVKIQRLLSDFRSCSGKMLRPRLVLLSGAACGRINQQHIKIAAIVEMIHNATLLHDDVIDDGQIRRGAATINILWGNEPAVLLGDFILTRVSKMCADLDPEINKAIALTTARICEGELRQVLQKQNWDLSEADFIKIITEKSAALFETCCFLGANLADADPKTAKSLGRFGLNTGIAFQIADDILDIVGSEAKMGKTLGADRQKNKPTLALVHLLTTLNQKEKKALKKKLNETCLDQKELKKMLKSSGSLEYASETAQKFVHKAVKSLADLKQSKAKDELVKTSEFVISRNN